MFDRSPKPKTSSPAAARAPERAAAPAAEPLQGLAAVPLDLGRIAFGTAGPDGRPKRRPNHVGLPEKLRAGVEALSGVAMDEVRVRYRSPEPARLGALAFARGRDIHLGPGQEEHLPHEAWHVVQQARGEVKTLKRVGATAVNDHPGLERDATAMGDLAMHGRRSANAAFPTTMTPVSNGDTPLQAKRVLQNGRWIDIPDNAEMEPGQVDERGLRRRRVPANATPVQDSAPEASSHPSGRAYWETHDAPTAHGKIAIGSGISQFLDGLVDPLALNNARKEATMHALRAKAEYKNSQPDPSPRIGQELSPEERQAANNRVVQQKAEARNMKVSMAHNLMTLGQGATATPLIHHLVPIPGAGDAAWYAQKAGKLRLEKARIKMHKD